MNITNFCIDVLNQARAQKQFKEGFITHDSVKLTFDISDKDVSLDITEAPDNIAYRTEYPEKGTLVVILEKTW